MKRASMVVLLVLGLSLICLAAADFSGTWALDKAKSDPIRMGRGGDAGGPPPNIEINLIIKQSGNELQITRNMIMGDNPPRTTEQKFTLDGAENKNPAPMGRGEMVSKSQWNNDVLIIEGSRKMSTPNGDFEIKSKDEYALSDGGKVLTITSTMSSPQGDRTSKQVFNKK
jgi:hypothetical protein